MNDKLPISPYDMPLWKDGPTEREIQREWNKYLNERMEKMLIDNETGKDKQHADNQR